MPENRLSCTVHVSLTLTIQHPQSWSEDATIASIHKSAKAEVVSRLKSELGKTNLKAGIKGEPRVAILSKEVGDD